MYRDAPGYLTVLHLSILSQDDINGMLCLRASCDGVYPNSVLDGVKKYKARR